MRRRAIAAIAVLVSACAPGGKTPASAAPPGIALVESAPIGTTLGHADLPDAADEWLAMIRGASRSIDLAEFYVSDAPQSRLHAVIDELRSAAARGVRVRLLVDEVFYAKYPETVDALGALPGVLVRRFDVKASMGGVLHAKYFVVDGRDGYVGSQNFDWRSLEHIQEVGVRMRSEVLAGALGSLFLADWDVAAGAPASRWEGVWKVPPVATIAGARVTLAASPSGYLPSEAAWDLPILISWIDGATASVDVQLLTYRTTTRDGAPWTDLDRALRRALVRGVRVRLAISSWGAKEASLAALADAGCALRIITVPPWSGGDVPFARVAHAKFAVFDGDRAWVGTSNWEGDYFTKSRNVSVFIEGGGIPPRLQAVFDDDFGGRYASGLPGR